MKNNIIFYHSKKYIKVILFGLIFLLIAPFLTMIIPMLKLKIIDQYIQNEDYHLVIYTTLIIILLHTLSHLFEWIHTKIFYITNCKIVKDVRGDIFYHIFFSKLSDTKKYEIGDLITRTEDDIKNMLVFYIDTIVNALRNFIIALISFSMLLYISLQMSLIISIFVIIYFILTNYFKKKIRKLSKTYLETISNSRNTLISLINRIVPIKINSYNKYSYDLYNETIEDKMKANIKLGTMRNTGEISIKYLLYLMPFMILLIGSLMTIKEIFTIGSIIAYLDYLNTMIQSIGELNEMNFNLAAAKISSERINEIINLETKNNNTNYTSSLQVKNITIAFDNHRVLDNINLNIQASDKLSIIGKSGAGKSTLINIITGNQNPQKGEVLYDNSDSFNGIYIPPEPYIFKGDLKSNIILNQDFNQKKYEEILNICLIDENIPPFNSSLLFNLSYGESQRVELARALYKSKKILIIDEGISNIDTKDLNIILDNLLNIKELALIYISHNDNIARKFDIQKKIENGKLLEI